MDSAWVFKNVSRTQKISEVVQDKCKEVVNRVS